MGKEILTFGDIGIEKKITAIRFLFFLKDVNTEKVLVSNEISFGEKNIITLLATCIMIIKLSH